MNKPRCFRIVICLAAAVFVSWCARAEATHLISWVITGSHGCSGGNTLHAYCGFSSLPPTDSGANVQNITANVYVPSLAHASARACDQSWSGSSLHCSIWTVSTTTGVVNLHVTGFSAISGATLSAWDYYYTEITCPTAGFALWGVEYL